jgi:hypothetical protein
MSNENTQTTETEIEVNGCTVRVEGHHPTGCHIKNSAIEQGLPIERHFCLFTQTADGRHVVADDEQVDIVRDHVFLASPHETEFEIFVNGQLVKVVGRQVTGRHIKGSAIEQGVAVEFTFVLTEEDEHGPHTVGDEDTVHLHKGARFTMHPRETEIIVNERAVRIAGHKASGLEIKRSAIAQGVSIHLDFVLSEEIGQHQSRIVGDKDIVELHSGSSFIAVAPDDNS